MIFEAVLSAEHRNFWLPEEPFIPWTDMLYFPIETRGALTPFREQVLNYVYRTALGLSGGLMESAIVEVLNEPDEEDSLHLHLAMTINIEWDEIGKLQDQVLELVSEWSQDWSEQQRDDYARWIFFSLTPTRL